MLGATSEAKGLLKEYTETIKKMEEEQAKVTAEYDALTKELAACKEEYDSYERKDIQYHENMKAQKSNLKKLRSKERENKEAAETKTKSVETMEQSLAQLEKDVVTLQEKKEAAEEALKAQSVAARTYTARKMASLGGKPCGRGGADVCTDSTCCQAYRTREELSEKWGSSADMYFDKLSGAVSATRGVILTYNGKPIEALFHSSSGGMTEDAANVFGGDAPYLKSVSSPGEEGFSRYSATVSFTRKQFANAVNAAIKGASII